MQEGRLGVTIADRYEAKSGIGSADATLTLSRPPLGSPTALFTRGEAGSGSPTRVYTMLDRVRRRFGIREQVHVRPPSRPSAG